MTDLPKYVDIHEEGYGKGFLDLVPGSHHEPRLWLEPIDRATEEFVDKTAHVVGRENESTFLVDQVAPTQGVVPDVG